MYLQLIITKRLDDGTLDRDHQRTERFERFPVVVGGDAAADLTMDGLPPRAVVIAGPSAPGEAFRLQELAAETTLERHHESLAAGAQLLNGDELVLNDGRHVRVVVGFTDARRKRHVQVVAGSAMVLVVLVMIAQLVYMFAVNRNTNVDTVLATELQRQKVYYLLDVLRTGFERGRADNHWPAESETGMAGEVIASELDRLAFHLREHGDEMTMEQLNRTFDDLERINVVYSRMGNGTFMPPSPTVDTEAALSAVTAKDLAP